MGEARLEHSASTHRRVQVTLNPLPRRPPPVHDELLSSWIGRLAKANHCSVEQLCGYLSLKHGRVPKLSDDLEHVNWARLCAAVQQTADEIIAMTLPDTMHLPLKCVSRDNFQICTECRKQTPELILRHWRFAWSLSCETCGRPLVARHPTDNVSNRLLTRAVNGAEVLQAAVDKKELKQMRRMDLILHVMNVLGIGHLTSLTSGIERDRLMALAAINVGLRRPILGAAIILRGNDGAVRELRRVFPQYRRVIAKTQFLSQLLDRQLPERREKECPLESGDLRKRSRTKASSRALQAARQAISELGPTADHQALLVRADAIWKRSNGVDY